MASHALPASHILDDDDASAAPSDKPSPLRRLYDAMIETQSRRAHREIERVLGPGALARALRTRLPPDA